MNKTTKLLTLTTIIFSTLFAGAPLQAGIRIGFTPAARIARDKGIEGKFEENQCLPYALALHEKFKAAGIPSKVIVYKYKVLLTAANAKHGTKKPLGHTTPADFAGSHAVVAYYDEGRTYIMDNQSWKPKWVNDSSISDLAQQFSGMDIEVGGAQVLKSGRSLKGIKPAGVPTIR